MIQQAERERRIGEKMGEVRGKKEERESGRRKEGRKQISKHGGDPGRKAEAEKRKKKMLWQFKVIVG